MPVVLARRRSGGIDTDTDDPTSAPERQGGDGDEDGGKTSMLEEMMGEKTPLLGLPMPDHTEGVDGDEGRNFLWWDVRNVRRGMALVPTFMWRGVWRRAMKSCILVAKVSCLL